MDNPVEHHWQIRLRRAAWHSRPLVTDDGVWLGADTRLTHPEVADDARLMTLIVAAWSMFRKS